MDRKLWREFAGALEKPLPELFARIGVEGCLHAFEQWLEKNGLLVGDESKQGGKKGAPSR